MIVSPWHNRCWKHSGGRDDVTMMTLFSLTRTCRVASRWCSSASMTRNPAHECEEHAHSTFMNCVLASHSPGAPDQSFAAKRHWQRWRTCTSGNVSGVRIEGSNQLMGSDITLKLACYGAAAALCAVTMAANLKFGLTLGSTPEEKAIYAIASVAADIFKCTAVVVVIRLWQKRQRWLAGVGAVIGVLCLTWSLASAAGFALATREHTAAMHAATSKIIDGWTTTIRRAGEQLALVEQSRPPAIIQAELAGQMVPSAVWKRTRECVELTLPESRDRLRSGAEAAARTSGSAIGAGAGRAD